jgi:uncharacterized damage-inducible protein DinB
MFPVEQVAHSRRDQDRRIVFERKDTMISPAEREFVLQLLDQSGARLLDLIQELSPEQLSYRPGPGHWSVADNVEHLLVSEKRLLPAIEKLLQEPPDLEKQSALSDAEVLRRVGTVVERVQAPPHALPTSRWPAQEISREFEVVRANTRGFAAATKGDLRHHYIRHFLFGELDCYQWLLLLGAHSNRHRAQAEAVKTSAGFPVALALQQAKGRE